LRRSTSGRIDFRAIAACLLAAAPAPAAEVPASAYSQSLLVPVELLDDDNLVFLFPQHGMELETQIQMTTIDGFELLGAGATGRFGTQAAMLLASDHQLIHADLTTLAQVAWAAGGSRWRAGLAARGTRFESSFENRTTRNGEVRDAEGRDRILRYSEAALGVGWRGERAFLDIVGEIYREDAEIRSFHTSPFDTFTVDFETNAKIRGRGAARFGIPLSSGTELRGWGSFRQLSNSLDAAQFPSVTGAVQIDHYGHEWSVALAVVHASTTGLARAYARYANVRSPAVPDETFGSLSVERRKLDVVRGGFSLERPIWWELRFLAGFHGTFGLGETVTTRTRSDGDVETFSLTTEQLSNEFSWGVQRAIGMFDLTGSLRTDLELTDLFVALDARLRFQ
jgi:hypothetical protein